MTKTQRRIEDHAIVLALYYRAGQFADLLDAAGNSTKAEDVRNEMRHFSNARVSERILNGEPEGN